MAATQVAEHAQTRVRRSRRLAALLVVLVAVLAVGYWLSTTLGNQGPLGVIATSGTIEADEAVISPETAGRIREIYVDEGDFVKPGDPIAQLDDAVLQSQVKQAQAALDIASASLALIQAGARPEEVRQAAAALAQATAVRDAGERSWRNTVALRDDPQELTAKINTAEVQVAAAQARYDQVKNGARPADLEAARSAVSAAQAGLAEAKASATAQEKVALETLNAAQSKLNLLKKGARAEDLNAAKLAVDQAKNALSAAQINRDGICENPLLPKYQCEAASAQVASAQNAVDIANNNLAKLKNGPLPDEVRVAESVVRQAQANLDAIRSTKAPSISAAEGAVRAATARLRQLEEGATSEELAIAGASLDQAKRSLADLQAIEANPLSANAQIDAASGQHEAAKAAVDLAEARLDALRNGPTREQIAVAKAQENQAAAAILVLQSQIDRLRLVSPASGLVSKRTVNVGDVVSPSTAILAIVTIDPVKLTVYVPEPLVGRVGVGQIAELTVDPYPGEVFRGEVVFIAPRAEFTPRNVTTQKDRATTVFAVKVRISNPDGRLKPGLAADAKLLAE